MDYADSDEDSAIKIPSKLVITGKSTMSLHERFSNLPAPRKAPKAAQTAVKKPSTATRFVEPVFDDFMEDDVYDPEDAAFDFPTQSSVRNGSHAYTRASLRRGGRGGSLRQRGMNRQVIRQAPIVIQEIAVPIEERLTLPKIVYVQAAPPRGVWHQYRGGRVRGNFNNFRGNFNKYQQVNRGPSTKPVFKRSFAPHQRGAFRGNRGRGAPQNFNNTFHGQFKKSAEEMDKEIDEYMKGGKHPRISF